jgi:hypothetical protein
VKAELTKPASKSTSCRMTVSLPSRCSTLEDDELLGAAGKRASIHSGGGGSDVLLIRTDANGNVAGCAAWSSVRRAQARRSHRALHRTRWVPRL